MKKNYSAPMVMAYTVHRAEIIATSNKASTESLTEKDFDWNEPNNVKTLNSIDLDF